MSKPISTSLLARHRALLPLVGEWFVTEWPSWYGPSGPGNLCGDLESYATSENAIPIGVLAFEGQVPVGFGAIKNQPIPGYENLGPWVGAGYVIPGQRRQGVGSVILAALVAKAKELGHEHLYCGTSTSESLLHRAGWVAIDVVSHDGKPLTVFRSAA